MTTSSKLTIDSRLEELTEARAWIETFASQHGFDEDTVYGIKLAFTEACSNVIRHAYKDEPGHDIEIKATVDDEKMCVTIRDFGEKIDLTRYKEPDLTVPQEGGYGIFLIETLMDEVRYDTSQPVGTVLHMVKYRNSS